MISPLLFLGCPLISLRGVTKSFSSPAGDIAVLRGIDLEVGNGQLIALVGRSGSGKSTLLNLMGGIDRPSSGSLSICGESIEHLTEAQLSAFRGRSVGFVFQFFQLL